MSADPRPGPEVVVHREGVATRVALLVAAIVVVAAAVANIVERDAWGVLGCGLIAVFALTAARLRLSLWPVAFELQQGTLRLVRARQPDTVIPLAQIAHIRWSRMSLRGQITTSDGWAYAIITGLRFASFARRIQAQEPSVSLVSTLV